MNRLKLILPLLLALVVFALPARADKYSINRDDLPQTAQKFLTDYFPKSKVSLVKTDNHLFRNTDYDVRLVNGTTIEFNNKGEWTEVDCKTKEVPSGLVIKPIKNYITKNFPGTFVVKIEKKTFGYELELNDGIELKFDRLGTYKSMKMDD